MEWKLTIEGMHCGGCAAGVVSALKKVAAVQSATADYAQGCARVIGDAGVEVGALKKAVEKAGFSVTAIEPV